MMEPGDPGDGFSVLDGVALVIGAAVASLHIRGVIREGLAGPGWVLVWGSFSWIAVTATGPFLFLVRRFARRLPGYPKVGDRLWALLGVPWTATAVLRAIGPAASPSHDQLVAVALGIGLAAASLTALAVVWSTWVVVSPERAARTSAAPWTNRVGLILSIAWPVQCGLGMVVIG